MFNTNQVSTNAALPVLARKHQREAEQASQQAIVAAHQTEGASLVAFVALQGVDLLASQVMAMHERHGDIVIPMVKPILDGYGKRVSGLIQGQR